MRQRTGAISFVGSYPGELPVLDLPEVAFAGRSNVGKSSALNCLFRTKKAARVSSTPGRTQTINIFRQGEEAAFADLPGYGFAKVPAAIQDAWKGMIEAYLAEREMLRLVVVLLDPRRDPTALDGMLVWGLREASIPMLAVATKMDKLTRNESAARLAVLRREYGLPEDQPIAFSSLDGRGWDQVWDYIEAACKPEASAAPKRWPVKLKERR
jgi:GTP-binding protein